MGVLVSTPPHKHMADANESLMSENCSVYNQSSSTTPANGTCTETPPANDSNSVVAPVPHPKNEEKVEDALPPIKPLLTVGPLPSPSLKATKTIQKPKQKRTSRMPSCGVCRKKLGVMGFDCRCGKLFCGNHRYSTNTIVPTTTKLPRRPKWPKRTPWWRPLNWR